MTERTLPSWFPTFGQFEVDNGTVTYIPTTPPASPTPDADSEEAPIGNIISNQWLADGEVTAKVMFHERSETIEDGSFGCEIMLLDDSERYTFVDAGLLSLSDGTGAYAIREFGSPTVVRQGAANRWTPLKVGGDGSFIKPNRAYHLRVVLVGSRITLEIDGVRLGVAHLRRSPATPRQVGLWCAGKRRITISDFKVDAKRPRAFVVMQFTKFEELYADVIKDACAAFGIDALRADEIYGPGIIIQDIVEQILASHLVIAEITPANANVYFEVGYALACNKPMILLAQRDTKLPFDVSGFRVLFYENTIGGKAKVETGLREHLAAIMRG